MALLLVACNAILLGVCDTLSHTTLYRQQIKRLAKQLTQELEQFTKTLYDGLGEAEEMQYYALVNTVEAGVRLLTTCTPTEIGMLTEMLTALRDGRVEVIQDDRTQAV